MTQTTRARPDGRSPEQAWPVREISVQLRDYIARLGRVWIEGQVVEVNRRSGAQVFLTVRDVDADVSVSVALPVTVDRAMQPPLEAGQRVLLHVQCEFWMRNGRLMLRAGEVRPVGIGELLATLERRKQQLAAEGLFAEALKRRLPLLPRRVGLITGVNAQAKHDVIQNAQHRWPGVVFEVREGAVQGPPAVATVIAALRELDAMEDVDVIVIARGGGSLEDLLPFSDESLIRAVAAVRTPVVSAIGHEQDAPLLDLVADVRASTPTDAGKRVVPDWAEEARRISERRRRADAVMLARLEAAGTWLEQTRSRPALADPAGMLPRLSAEVTTLRARAFRAVDHRLTHDERDLAHVRARARTLSPLATLDRGYAIVKGPDGHYVRAADTLTPGDAVRVRVAAGHFGAEVLDVASPS
ncbi:MAG TPA: exodeoxyribonuclease VII large subunit [Candidatus Nanopelagicales bacterium]